MEWWRTLFLVPWGAWNLFLRCIALVGKTDLHCMQDAVWTILSWNLKFGWKTTLESREFWFVIKFSRLRSSTVVLEGQTLNSRLTNALRLARKFSYRDAPCWTWPYLGQQEWKELFVKQKLWSVPDAHGMLWSDTFWGTSSCSLVPRCPWHVLIWYLLRNIKLFAGSTMPLAYYDLIFVEEEKNICWERKKYLLRNIELFTGSKMPLVGLGTWHHGSQQEMSDAVRCQKIPPWKRGFI